MITAFLATILLAFISGPAQEPMSQLTERVFSRAEAQFTALDARLPEDKMPVTFENGEPQNGKLNGWTSGFFPGSLWLVYEYTGDGRFREMAERQTAKLNGITAMKTHHDIGFQVNSSFGNGYRLTGKPEYLDMMRSAAVKLSQRFSPVVGCTRSWDPGKRWNYPVIIDNMMNLELLMTVSRLTGDGSLAAIAKTHSNTTMRNHFRDDFSTWHVVAYDEETGEVLKKQTSQGFCDDSAWSRGQAWGLYGYTMMYRESGDTAYLAQARGIASFILPLLPEDGIPEWDFNAPGTAHAMGMDAKGAPKPEVYKWKEGDPVFRDSSAGAILASALIELSTYGDADGLYLSTAEKILRTLASPEYLAPEGENGNFLIRHGVTNLHGWSGVDIPLTYGDYYFLEALLKYRRLFQEPMVMARYVPERKDDFVFENELVCGRFYGKAIEGNPTSPGIDVWVKLPGKLVANEWYRKICNEGQRGYYHRDHGGKDCYQVGVSLGGGASAPLIGGRLCFPPTNYRSWEVLENYPDKTVFVLHYPEWTVDGISVALDKKVTVTPGTYFVKCEDTWTFSGAPGKKLAVAAGIFRHVNLGTVEEERLDMPGRYALWEQASDQHAEPEEGRIGLAVVMPGADAVSLSDDSSHGLCVKKVASGETLTYWFGSCWSKGDIKTPADWFSLVEAFE